MSDKIEKWKPQHPAWKFSEFGNDLFSQDYLAKLDIKETSDSYIVKADLPGFTKDNIQVDVNDDVLTIKGERKREEERKEERYHAIERQYGMFQRMIPVANVIAEKITASFKDGVLEIILPKKEKKSLKQLSVKVE